LKDGLLFLDTPPSTFITAITDATATHPWLRLGVSWVFKRPKIKCFLHTNFDRRNEFTVLGILR